MPHLLADVKSAESCRLEAYQDTLGFWTIGYGHKLPVGKDWSGLKWTQDQADSTLAHELNMAYEQAQTLLEWTSLDTDARQNAVVELVYNMGFGHWKLFAQTRMALHQKNWQAAHDGLLASLWASQVHATRANRLADYLLSGEFNGESKQAA